MLSDFNFIVIWWILFFIIGVVNFPLCFKLFGKFTDRGYGVSKTLGFLITSYLVFVLGIFKILPFTRLTISSMVTVLAIANAVILIKNKEKIISFIRKNPRVLILQETLFTSGYVFWSLVRGYHPDINGLEKLMDQGFINSLLRSTYLPPVDMWFAGEPINYYWFGHFWVALATKLSAIPSNITYNLMLATILGLALTSAFSLVSTMVANLKTKMNRRTLFAAGIVSAVMLVFAGNLHTPIYIAKEGRDKYWYPDATRFIGYNPETEDKTIHEFPMYSFVVSDLHAHLINFPIVLLYISLLFSAAVNSKKVNPKSEIINTKQYKNTNSQISKLFGSLKFNVLNLFRNSNLGFSILSLGFILGLMFMTSTWDFGSYLMVTGFVLLFTQLAISGVNIESVFKAVIKGVAVAAIGIVVALPFIINFVSIAEGIDTVNARTPLWQLGVLWGFPAIMTSIYLYVIGNIGFKKMKISDVFTLALLTASWMLIVLPEVIYVKDIYIASHHRANTMFKLTYQAFVMFYLLSGYIAARTIILSKGIFAKAGLLLFYSVLFLSLLNYAKISTKSYYRDLQVYEGLDGETWLASSRPDIYATILWFRENVDGQPAILEAPGDSYTEYNVISSYTGLPTVSGWFVHEWLWRGDAKYPQERVGEIGTIYTSPDIEQSRQLLGKYNVEYVIISNFEREKFSNLIENKFMEIGQLVYSNETVNVYNISN